jgi:hypothetical protein
LDAGDVVQLPLAAIRQGILQKEELQMLYHADFHIEYPAAMS